MPRKNYKELWEQLKVVLACGPKKRYPNNSILQVMTNLELKQEGQEVSPVAISTGSHLKKT